MELYPTVIVNRLDDARVALAHAQAEGKAVTLLSTAGAALFAGCGWWQALVARAQAEYPDVPCIDILDCADATGHGLAALRIGLTRLVLWPTAPGRDAVVAIANSLGGFVLAAPPAVERPQSDQNVTVAMRNDGAVRSPAQEPGGRPNGDKPRPTG